MLCCWGRHWIPGWKSLGSQLQERNRLMLLGRLVVLTWHSCLRLPLPPQRSVELRLLPIRGTGSQQESRHLSKGCEHPLGAHDWPDSILTTHILGPVSEQRTVSQLLPESTAATFLGQKLPLFRERAEVRAHVSCCLEGQSANYTASQLQVLEASEGQMLQQLSREHDSGP